MNGKKSKDRETLIEYLQGAIDEGDVVALKAFWNSVKESLTRLRPDLEEEEEAALDQAVLDLRKQQAYVLRRGEIEHYLPAEFRSLNQTVELVKEENFETWLSQQDENEHLQELREIVSLILGVEVGGEE